jgi:type 1 glutamine amidotransferase
MKAPGRITLFITGLAGIALLATSMPGQQNSAAQAPKKKKLLIIAQTKGFTHDSITHGASVLEQMGRQSGIYDTYFRTDCALVTKKKLEGNAKNLTYFDAVAFFPTGEMDLDDSQKADLLSFIREDGKGFIGMHTAGDTNYNWADYGEMVGGYFDQHPWNTFNAPIIVDDQTFPATKHFPKEFVINDEIYQYKNYSRDKVRVLMRLDPNKIDLKNPRVHRTDKDFAVAWVKSYGKGRVFATTLGHREEVYDNPNIQKMFMEAIKWSMGMTEGNTAPISLPKE